MTKPVPAATTGSFAVAKRLAHDYLQKQISTLALAVACMLVTAASSGLLAWLLDPVIKLLFLDKRADMLLIIPAAVLGIMWMRAASYFVQQSLIETVGERVVAAAQRDMFHSLVYRDLASLNAVHSGKFVSNFLYDATLMRDAITRGVAGVALEFVSLVAFVFVMLYQDWRLAIISVFALPGVAWAMERIGSSMRRTSTRNMEETGTLSTVVSEALDGRRVIKAYGQEEHTAKRANQRLDARLKQLIKLARTRAAAVPATDIFAGLVIAATVFYAGYQSLHGEVSFNHFASFIAAMLLAQQPVRNLSTLWAIASSGVSAANRVFAIIDARPEIVDAPEAKTLVVKPAPAGGAVTFKNVSFTYHADANSPAVNRVNIEIAPGKKVAIVGPSGAGKTTIFNLLLRFYDIDSGAIEIDGHDIRAITLQSLRRNIALVTQEPILFDESVADNIALGKDGAGRADIERAAQNASAHEFIMQLPEGYNTRIGEGGLKLSGGQRQRIAIARAMLRDAPILLLDEATSALDTESERHVQEALSLLMKDRTTIVIAHRLSTVVDADLLYVLDRGRVVESGTHAELMAMGGLYARLYQQNDLENETAVLGATAEQV